MNRAKLLRIKDFITPVTRRTNLVDKYKSFARVRAKDLYSTPICKGLRFVIRGMNVSETRCNKEKNSKINENFPNQTKNFSKNSSIDTFIVPNVFWYSTYKTNYTIVRPLMKFSRRTVTLNCRLRGLPVYPDLSNSKLRYSRNRIRKQIIPAIKFLLNPKIERALFQFSEFYNRDIALNRVNNL